MVLELQRDALSHSTRVSVLVRKSLVVARKLNISEFTEWASLELKGYPTQDQVPAYRVVTGQMRVWNPYHGWIPFVLNSPEQVKFFSTGKLTQQIGEIENLLERLARGSVLELPYPPEMEEVLIGAMEVPLRPSLHIDRSQIYGILEAVRNIILEWSLKLEESGILGEGMAFSQEEKTTAATATQVINFFGSVSNSQIQHGTTHSTQTMTTQGPDLQKVRQLIESLKPIVDNLGLEQEAKAQLSVDIQTVETQLSAPKPNRPIIKEALLSGKSVLENAAGSILATEILTKFMPLFLLLLS